MMNVITPDSIMEMTVDDICGLLDDIREQRLFARVKYEESVASKEAAKEERAYTQLCKQIDMLAKDLDRLEKLMTKVDDRVLNVLALRLQCGVLPKEHIE